MNIYDVFQENQSLKIKQQRDLIEMLVGNDYLNIYEVILEDGKLLLVEEESEFVQRICCRSLRSLKYTVSYGNTKILHLERSFHLFCSQMSVYQLDSNSKRFIGKIETKFNLFKREYSIKNSEEKEIYQISGHL